MPTAVQALSVGRLKIPAFDSSPFVLVARQYSDADFLYSLTFMMLFPSLQAECPFSRRRPCLEKEPGLYRRSEAGRAQSGFLLCLICNCENGQCLYALVEAQHMWCRDFALLCSIFLQRHPAPLVCCMADYKTQFLHAMVALGHLLQVYSILHIWHFGPYCMGPA